MLSSEFAVMKQKLGMKIAQIGTQMLIQTYFVCNSCKKLGNFKGILPFLKLQKNLNPLGPIERLSVSSKIKNTYNCPKGFFLYLQNGTTYSIKFGIVIKLAMSSKTSGKEI